MTEVKVIVDNNTILTYPKDKLIKINKIRTFLEENKTDCFRINGSNIEDVKSVFDAIIKEKESKLKLYEHLTQSKYLINDSFQLKFDDFYIDDSGLIWFNDLNKIYYYDYKKKELITHYQTKESDPIIKCYFGESPGIGFSYLTTNNILIVEFRGKLKNLK